MRRTDWGDTLRVSAEARDAIAAGRPVVALESTLVTHGLPQPQNLEVALDAEAAIREAGATPATVAVVDGALRVGLTVAELQALAEAGERVAKVSRRSLAATLAQRGTGGTTVSATMIAATAAGIEVFATGGIGGVHRGHPIDVSADLDELARTPVAVVSAGPKAILDIPATLEYLETRGVPVVTVGAEDVPAFYSRSSGIRSPLVARSVDELARIARIHLGLLATGVLICVPIPATDEIPRARIEALVESAIADADAAGIGGPELTPWLLTHLATATEGASVRANQSLIVNNARTAARLAVAMAGTRDSMAVERTDPRAAPVPSSRRSTP